jgi:hypothetical protein
MIPIEEARSIVEAELSRLDSPDVRPSMAILENSTIERDWGWVFFYQSVEYLETGNPSDQLAGNAPYIVNRHTGELVATGTAWPIEKYIEDYETRLLSSS